MYKKLTFSDFILKGVIFVEVHWKRKQPQSLDMKNETTLLEIQLDSKRWTQFRTSIFPELYMVCE